MPYLETAQSWLTQSTLLLQARPTTTRITSKYTINPPKSSKSSKSRRTKAAKEPTEPTAPAAAPAPSATLTLKTYDDASGACLKYSTDKAAEVSRLIQILGRLARPMCGLPEVKEEVPILGAGAGEGEGSGAGGVGTPTVESVPALAGGGKPGQQAQGGGAGGKKKKKGKK